MSNAACTDSCVFDPVQPGDRDVAGRGAEAGERGGMTDRPPDRGVARKGRGAFDTAPARPRSPPPNADIPRPPRARFRATSRATPASPRAGGRRRGASAGGPATCWHRRKCGRRSAFTANTRARCPRSSTSSWSIPDEPTRGSGNRKPETAGSTGPRQGLTMLLAQCALHRDAHADRREVRRDRGAAPPPVVDRRAATLTRDHQAAAWMLSCTSPINAWFAAADNPVTSAWSIVARGINVRSNVTGALAAANRMPAWFARP